MKKYCLPNHKFFPRNINEKSSDYRVPLEFPLVMAVLRPWLKNLVRTLSSEFEFTVYCSSKAYSRKLPEIYGAKLKYIPFRANGIQSIPYDIWSILSALKSADVL